MRACVCVCFFIFIFLYSTLQLSEEQKKHYFLLSKKEINIIVLSSFSFLCLSLNYDSQLSANGAHVDGLSLATLLVLLLSGINCTALQDEKEVNGKGI